MSERKLRAGVIGLGVGRAHAKGYIASPDAELVALCDANTERLNQYAAEWNIDGRYSDYHTMFREAQLDVVSIGLPNALHAEASIAALEAGVHVICEKPMATTSAEARAMLAAARQHNRQLMVCYNYRYRSDSQWMRRVIQSGRLGQVHHVAVSWRRETGIPGWGLFGSKAASGGGALIDLGVHVIDLGLWLLEFPRVQTISGHVRSLFGPYSRKTWGKSPSSVRDDAFDVDDGGVAFMRLSNGATMSLQVTWAEHSQPHEDAFRVEVQGTDGTAILHVRNYKNEDTLRFYTEIEGAPVTVIPSVNFDGHQGHAALIVDLAASLRAVTPPAATGEQGLIAVEILEALYQSAAAGHEVRIDGA